VCACCHVVSMMFNTRTRTHYDSAKKRKDSGAADVSERATRSGETTPTQARTPTSLNTSTVSTPKSPNVSNTASTSTSAATTTTPIATTEAAASGDAAFFDFVKAEIVTDVAAERRASVLHVVKRSVLVRACVCAFSV
jgi:hypothetical protein